MLRYLNQGLTMGYSHDWDRPRRIGKQVWRKIISDFCKVLPHLGIKLRGKDHKLGPTVTDDIVMFTNYYPYAKRPFYPQYFYFPRVVKDDNDPGGCKTRQRQYDLAVMVFLIIAKHYLKNRLRIYSDGSIEEWYPAVKKCITILGYGLEEVKQMNLNEFLFSCEHLPWWQWHAVVSKKINQLLSELEELKKTSQTCWEEDHESSTSGSVAGTHAQTQQSE